MTQDKNMNLFMITEHSLKITKKNKYKGVSMIIAMKRKVTSELMSKYFPSLLLMLNTFAITFFKQLFFEAALSVRCRHGRRSGRDHKYWYPLHSSSRRQRMTSTDRSPGRRGSC